MRISWRELDWISERDRTEIERRMHLLGGESGLLDRVDFAGRASSTTGGFEIRITANAAKRQIIAVRRDAQRVKAFNSAFEALERSVVSVLKTQSRQPAQASAGGAAAPSARSQPRPALSVPETPSRIRSWVAQRGARTAAAVVFATVLVGIGWVALRMQGEPRALRDVSARGETPAFSAVAKLEATAPGETARARRETEPLFSAVAQLRER